MFVEYPKCKYSASEDRVVNSREEDDALGNGWFDSPSERDSYVAEAESIESGEALPVSVEPEKAPKKSKA